MGRQPGAKLTHFGCIPATHYWMLTDVLPPLHEDNHKYQYKYPVVYTAILQSEGTDSDPTRWFV